MAAVAVLGEWARIKGFGLAGARTIAAENPGEVRAAWRSIGEDVAVVIVTPRAAAELEDEPGSARSGHKPMLVVMPG